MRWTAGARRGFANFFLATYPGNPDLQLFSSPCPGPAIALGRAERGSVNGETSSWFEDAELAPDACPACGEKKLLPLETSPTQFFLGCGEMVSLAEAQPALAVEDRRWPRKS